LFGDQTSRVVFSSNREQSRELPVSSSPIRNAVLFPGAVAPFDVGREKSVALVEDIDNLPRR
jgi:ATP-dependent Lon protease